MGTHCRSIDFYAVVVTSEMETLLNVNAGGCATGVLIDITDTNACVTSRSVADATNKADETQYSTCGPCAGESKGKFMFNWIGNRCIYV
jgi:hypothetical protein